MAATSDNTAGIVIIGDEILSGKFADENAVFLIGALRELGVSLRRITVIPDDLDTIAETVPQMSERFSHVFTSGGVGPTHDDVTMEGISRGFGTTVVVHPALRTLLEAYYGERMTPERMRLAEVPDGATLVTGEKPGWPVVCYDNVYILPGVPALFARKFQSIQERFRAQPFAVARIYCTGEESDIATRLSAAVAAHPGVSFGSYPRFDETDFKIILTLEGKDVAAVRLAMDALAGDLGSRVVKTEAPE
jgi:molybdenum cofactor synthesis domain-containing protein